MATILVVDDSVFQQHILRKHLEKAGYDVILANDGQQALDHLNETQPLCLVIDLIMPNMNGQELLRWLRQQDNPPPVIVSTADIQHSTYEECMALGAYGVLNKPINKQALLNLLSQIEES
jgi:CheY-like chemotaxis protein